MQNTVICHILKQIRISFPVSSENELYIRKVLQQKIKRIILCYALSLKPHTNACNLQTYLFEKRAQTPLNGSSRLVGAIPTRYVNSDATK